MTLTEQVKILDGKIKSTKAQYDLDREAAKISALSSDELQKYDYSTSEHLGYKSDVIQKAKFEYSALGKVFNSDKKEGVLKRLSNIKDANEKQLQAIKDEHLKLVKRIKDEKPKLKSLRYQIDKKDKRQLEYFDKLVNMETTIDYTKLYYQSGNKNKDAFNFNEFGSMVDFFQRINTERINLEDAESRLVKLRNLLHLLRKTVARKKFYKEKKAEVYKNANLLFEGQKLIYSRFINGLFGKNEQIS